MIPKRRYFKYIVVLLVTYILMVYVFIGDDRNDITRTRHHTQERQRPITTVSGVNVESKNKSELISSDIGNATVRNLYMKIADQEHGNEPTKFSSIGCPNSEFRIEIPSATIDKWQTAFKEPYILHMFSAYVGNRDEGLLKIMAVTHMQRANAFCQMWYDGGIREMHETTARVYVVPETHGKRYMPVIISCELPSGVNSMPTAVSLASKQCDQPKAFLRPHYRSKDWQPKHTFTLCPAPLNRWYNKLGEFLQYVEVNGLFGADHFIFYNHSVSDKLIPFLDYYTEKGKIEIIQWDIPVNVNNQGNEIHYYGQVIAQSECFYRAMMNSQYVVALDMDEVIVPMKSRDWGTTIGDDPSVAAYVFHNIFFKKEWQQNSTFKNHDLMKEYPLDALLYTNHETQVWPIGSRSKYIARPEGVKGAGIHFPMSLNRGYTTKDIPAKDGILAHFRNWEDYREDVIKVKQTRLHDFSDEILQRVSKVVSEVKKTRAKL